MTEADELCERVAFLAGGRIVALDTPRALKLSLGGGAPAADVVLDDGADVRLALSEPRDAARLQELIDAGRVRSIHSREAHARRRLHRAHGATASSTARPTRRTTR